MARKVCAYWECGESIRSNYTVCRDHYPEFADGLLDECQSCGQLKSIEYEVCKNCYGESNGRKSRTANARTVSVIAEAPAPYAVGAPSPGPQRDDETPVFFVYILERSDGSYYIGQTNHLRARLREHRRKAKSGSELSGTLEWFSLQPTRKDAEQYEDYLNRVLLTNERAITRLLTDFEAIVSELGKN